MQETRMRKVTRTLANDVNPDGVGRRPNTEEESPCLEARNKRFT